MKLFTKDLVLIFALMAVMLACHVTGSPVQSAQATVTIPLAIPALPAPKYSYRETQCVRNAVYGEARGEPFAVQVAVAATVLTRAKSGKWPRNLCKVVRQPHQFQGYSTVITLNGEGAADSWDAALEATTTAMEQYDRLPWQMRHATHFHTYTGKTHKSSAAFTHRYGNLLFYSYG